MSLFKRQPKIAAPYRLGDAAAQIFGNFLLTTDGRVLAGYRVGPRRWEYTPDGEKSRVLTASADVFGVLSGREFHERVSARPHPIADWAARLDARTPHPLPDLEGGHTWNRWLARQQARIAQAGMDEKLIFRYFGVGQVKPGTDLRRAVQAAIESGQEPRDKAVAAVIRDERLVADAVAAWPARRMSEREQAWLRVRSAAPGLLPAPMPGWIRDGWDAQSLPALADHVRWAEEPFGRTVTVRSVQDGRTYERAVQVLSAARLDDLNYPENGLEPWQTYAERALDGSGMPFAVEWSLVGDLRTGEQMAAEAELDLRKAIHLERDFREHGEPAPAGVAKGIAVAKSTRDAVHEGREVEAGRFVGSVNAIITGEPLMRDGRQIASAAEVCEDRAAAFVRLFKGNDLRMEFAAAQPQSLKLAETIPGQPRERHGYQVQMRYDYLAAALPNASDEIGDDSGPLLGHTRGPRRRAVMHDPHYATMGQGARGRGNNWYVIAGELGSGKSMLAGLIAYGSAVRRCRVVISDPSGPMAKLAQLLPGHAQVIDLLQGRRGILSPPALIREPRKEEFDEDGQWADAVAFAAAERRDLVADIARRCLGSDLYENPDTIAVLREAARSVHWYAHHTMWDLVAALIGLHHPFATQVANALMDAANAPMLSLLFPRRGTSVVLEEMYDVYDATLTVITTPGVRRAADGTPREDWTHAEHGADVVLRLVGLFTDRLIYGKPKDEPLVAIFDEAENMTDYGPGRAFFSRLGRDHSKWNIAVYMLVKSINPQMLSGELRNFLAGAFVGRMANIDSATEMLNVLNVRDQRYAQTLMRLSEVTPGEFVHLDADGRVGSMRVDLDYLPALKSALMTNPRGAGADAWISEGDI